MTEKLALLHPEITLFVATCVVMVLGLSRNAATRRLTSFVAGLALIIAFVLSLWSPQSGGLFPSMLPFTKATIAGVSFLLLLSLVGVVDRDYESMISRGGRLKAGSRAATTSIGASTTWLPLISSVMRQVPAIACMSGTSKPCWWNHCSAKMSPPGRQ